MFSWIWITITKPCAIAIIATIFAEHLSRAIFPEAWVSIWLDKLVALVGLALITALNCVGTNTGASAANAFLVLKLSALFSIVLIGFVAGATKDSAESTEPSQVVEPDDVQVWNIIGEYVTALFGALFCYGGWETVSTTAGY
jgi:amino acid transporter